METIVEQKINGMQCRIVSDGKFIYLQSLSPQSGQITSGAKPQWINEPARSGWQLGNDPIMLKELSSMFEKCIAFLERKEAEKEKPADVHV